MENENESAGWMRSRSKGTGESYMLYTQHQ